MHKSIVKYKFDWHCAKISSFNICRKINLSCLTAMQYLFHRLFRFYHSFRTTFEHGLLRYKITTNKILFCTVIIRRDTVCKHFQIAQKKKTDIFCLYSALIEGRFIFAFLILIILVLYEIYAPILFFQL